MSTVLVGCRLPCGITLDGTAGPVTLNGTNTSMIDGGCGLTHVDATEWLYLSAVYAEHSAFKSEAVFNYKDSNAVADVLAINAELKDEKTGFEALDPTKPAPGLTPEDPTKLREMINKNRTGVKVPAKKAANKQDQAAAVEAAVGA